MWGYGFLYAFFYFSTFLLPEEQVLFYLLCWRTKNDHLLLRQNSRKADQTSYETMQFLCSKKQVLPWRPKNGHHDLFSPVRYRKIKFYQAAEK